MAEEKGKMTVEEAGRKGGKTTSGRYGHEFYEDIGQKGGKTTSKKHGHEFYQDIGHKGGQKVKRLIEEGKREEM
jgi:hypothetical protein